MADRINLDNLPTELPHRFIPIDGDHAECVHCGVAETTENTSERCIARERHATGDGNPFKSADERRTWEEPPARESN